MNIITFLTIAAAICFSGVTAVAFLYTIAAYNAYKESLQYRGDVDYHESEYHYSGYLRSIFLTLTFLFISITLWSM